MKKSITVTSFYLIAQSPCNRPPFKTFLCLRGFKHSSYIHLPKMSLNTIFSALWIERSSSFLVPLCAKKKKKSEKSIESGSDNTFSGILPLLQETADHIGWKSKKRMTESISHVKHSASMGLDSPLEGSICRPKFSRFLKKLSLVAKSKFMNYQV